MRKNSFPDTENPLFPLPAENRVPHKTAYCGILAQISQSGRTAVLARRQGLKFAPQFVASRLVALKFRAFTG
jgi:hypothetical protein